MWVRNDDDLVSSFSPSPAADFEIVAQETGEDTREAFFYGKDQTGALSLIRGVASLALSFTITPLLMRCTPHFKIKTDDDKLQSFTIFLLNIFE